MDMLGQLKVTCSLHIPGKDFKGEEAAAFYTL